MPFETIQTNYSDQAILLLWSLGMGDGVLLPMTSKIVSTEFWNMS